MTLTVVLTMSLRACGDSGKETGASHAGEADPDGVLKYGTQLTISGVHFDPTSR